MDLHIQQPLFLMIFGLVSVEYGKLNKKSIGRREFESQSDPIFSSHKY
jgi:hypothetical protein